MTELSLSASSKEPSLKTVAKEKFILDATAGFRMMWFDKKHPNCIYLDQRPECEPDIVGDFKNLSQFPNGMFKLIIFDPPFWIRSSHNTTTFWKELEPWSVQSTGLQTRKPGLLPLFPLKDRLRGSRVTLKTRRLLNE